MAISHSANISAFNYIFRNEDHRTNIGATTYLGTQFPNIVGDFTISFWVHLSDEEFLRILRYSGPGVDPAYFEFNADVDGGGHKWYWQYSTGGTGFTRILIGDVTVHEWIHLCYRRSGDSHSVFYVKETDTSAAAGPVTLAFPNHEVHLEFPFDQFTLQLGRGMKVCALKIWDKALTDVQVNDNRAVWFTPSGAPQPIWQCHLRRAGDTYSSAVIPPNDFWHDNFEWTETPDAAHLVYFTDPFILQRAPCSSFLIPGLGVENALPRFPDFQAGVGLTTKYALDITYFQVENRHTVPINYASVPIPDQATYDEVMVYGIPQYQGIRKQTIPPGGVQATLNYVAYFNEAGIKAETTIPFDVAGYNATALFNASASFPNVYIFRWGSGFIWNNTTGAVAKAYPGELRQPVIQVKYTGTWILEQPIESALRISQLPIEIIIGFPGEDVIQNGPITPIPPRVVTIGGVYFFNPVKSEWHDQYYVTTAVPDGKKKIPDPVIKTALIGE